MNRLKNIVLGSAVATWRERTDKILHERFQTRLAVQHFMSRRCALILGMWHSNAQDARINLNKMRKTIHRIRNMAMVVSVDRWRQHTVRSRTHKFALGGARRKLKRKRIKKAFCAWRDLTESISRTKIAVHERWTDIQSCFVRTVLSCWHRRSHGFRSARAVTERINKNILVFALAHLSSYREKRRKIRLVAANVYQREPKICLNLAITNWCRTTRNRRRRMMKVASAAARLNRMTTKSAFVDWLLTAESCRKSSRIFSFISNSTTQRTIKRMLRSWTELGLRRRRLCLAFRRGTSALQRAMFVRTLATWQDNCLGSKKNRHRFNITARRVQGNLIRGMWRVWMISILARRARAMEISGRRAALAETRLCVSKLASEVTEIQNIWRMEVRAF